jgi:Protein of unknown function (DUF3618)
MTDADRPDAGESPTTEQLRHEIEATRAQLGDTVEALAHKADVKSRMRDTLDEKKHAVADKVHDAVDAAREIRDHLRHQHH